MKFDKENCLGGRINGKEVVGIRYGGYTIFPKDEYNIIYSGGGLYTNPSLPDMPGYIETNSIDSDGITTRNIRFNAAPMDLIRFTYDTKSISKLKGCFSRYCIGDGSTLSPSQLEFVDLSETDTSCVTNMLDMFVHCANLTTLDLSSFDTSNVTNMNFMFHGCTKLEELNLSNWNMSSCVYADGMFEECTSLHTLRLDNCDYTTVKNIACKVPDRTGQEIRGKIYVNREACKRYGEIVSCQDGWDFIDCETNEVIN